jgi:two-component system, cell cycle sensor histidine kinase and response regulator CckA
MGGIPNTIDAGLAQEVRALCGLDFDTSPFPMWIHDRRTLAFVAVNSATVAHYGFSRTEFLRMTILDIRPPEDVPRIVKDVLYPHFHDPDGDLRRHRTKKGKLIHVGIKAYKLRFNDRDVEVVVVEVPPHTKDGLPLATRPS